jgi:hypothetical protein
MTMTKWLHRRRETVLDTQPLFARVRESRNLSEVVKAQQDWMTGAFRRLTEDAADYQKTACSPAILTKREFAEDEKAGEPSGLKTAENAAARGKASTADTSVKARP